MSTEWRIQNYANDDKKVACKCGSKECKKWLQ